MAPARARVSDDNVVLHANPKRERYCATDVLPAPVMTATLPCRGKHHRYYISVDRLALPLNRERAQAAIQMGGLSGWLAGGGLPVHSVALTDEGLGVLRARRIID
jgi:hypothetical protein